VDIAISPGVPGLGNYDVENTIKGGIFKGLLWQMGMGL